MPRIALTATATEATHREITERLHLDERAALRRRASTGPTSSTASSRRTSRASSCSTSSAGRAPRATAGIVYASRAPRVEKTAEFLAANGITALPYHAGLDAARARAHQSRFLREDGVVMVATIAFGMGIDKPDVRFVAHLDLPK